MKTLWERINPHGHICTCCGFFFFDDEEIMPNGVCRQCEKGLEDDRRLDMLLDSKPWEDLK